MTMGQASFFNVRAWRDGDGQTDMRDSIRDHAAGRGSGTVFLPAGRYLTGRLFLRNNISLHLDSGAVILGSEDPGDYPIVHSRWEGKHQDTHAPLITGQNLSNVSVTGRGTIDGRGAFGGGEGRAHPRLRRSVFPIAPMCTSRHYHQLAELDDQSRHCQNVHSCRHHHQPRRLPNTDGINPDSCRLVRISDCYVSVGDDCITIKSGTEHEHPDLYAPCRDITITNCTLERGHGGVVIGSEMSGGVKNVVISNCVFIGTDRGIRIKSRRGRGGAIEDIRVSNLIMDASLSLHDESYYHIGGAAIPISR
jgi:polygalacturonase